jgi:hypothetical protein
MDSLVEEVKQTGKKPAKSGDALSDIPFLKRSAQGARKEFPWSHSSAG